MFLGPKLQSPHFLNSFDSYLRTFCRSLSSLPSSKNRIIMQKLILMLIWVFLSTNLWYSSPAPSPSPSEATRVLAATSGVLTHSKSTLSSKIFLLEIDSNKSIDIFTSRQAQRRNIRDPIPTGKCLGLPISWTGYFGIHGILLGYAFIKP